MTTKMVPCKFYQKGLCCKGSSCSFSHSTPAGSAFEHPEAAAKVRRDNLTRGLQRPSASCYYFLEGRCMKGAKCPRRHDSEGPGPSVRSSEPCSFFLEGNCSFGNTCRRSHSCEGTLPTNAVRPSRDAWNTATQPVFHLMS